MTQSFDFFADIILIWCKVHEYHCRIVDANVKGVLLREIAQEAMVSTNLFHGVKSRGMGKELSQFIYAF